MDESSVLNALDTFSEIGTRSNAMEGFKRHLCKATKTMSVFLTDDSLLKMLYLT